MRGNRAALFVHLVWATWNREPFLTGERERRIHRCLIDTCHELDVDVLALGGVEDHVHMVVRIPPTLSVAELVKRLKGASSHLATHEVDTGNFFKWQGGYGAFSTGLKQLATVCEYVRHQREHHHAGTLVSVYEPNSTRRSPVEQFSTNTTEQSKHGTAPNSELERL